MMANGICFINGVLGELYMAYNIGIRPNLKILYILKTKVYVLNQIVNMTTKVLTVAQPLSQSIPSISIIPAITVMKTGNVYLIHALSIYVMTAVFINIQSLYLVQMTTILSINVILRSSITKKQKLTILSLGHKINKNKGVSFFINQNTLIVTGCLPEN